MRVTDKTDGIHILNHGVISVQDMVEGKFALDPSKLGQALAKINRYAGNTIVPWNDAEHSALVATLVSHVPTLLDVEELFLQRSTVVDTVKLWRDLTTHEDRLEKLLAMAYHWGLLHDVVEVVVGDTPNPVKKFEEHMVGRSGDTAEDKLVQVFKAQQLGRYAMALAEDCTGLPHHHDTTRLVAGCILDLLQDYVKPADKLALLVEMKYMHNTSVLDYVERLWQVNLQAKAFIYQFDWSRLEYQVAYENIDWRNSSRYWSQLLQRSKRELETLFQ